MSHKHRSARSLFAEDIRNAPETTHLKSGGTIGLALADRDTEALFIFELPRTVWEKRENICGRNCPKDLGTVKSLLNKLTILICAIILSAFFD